MKRFLLILSAAAFACALLLIPQVSSANWIANGDFETADTWGPIGSEFGPDGWVLSNPQNPAGQQSGATAIGGAGTSALFTTTQGNAIEQDFEEDTAALWQLDFDIVTKDPGGSGDRCLSAGISRLDSEDAKQTLISYRINGEGDVQVYDRGGFGWYTPSGLAGAVIFDGDLDDTSQLVNHVSIVGNFDLATPSYDIIVTDSNNDTSQATGLTYWNHGDLVAPATGDGIMSVTFSASSIKANYLLDNVSLTSVPEPATLAMLFGLGLLFVLRRRK